MTDSGEDLRRRHPVPMLVPVVILALALIGVIASGVRWVSPGGERHIIVAHQWERLVELSQTTQTGCPTIAALRATTPLLRDVTAAEREAVAVVLTGRGC